MTDNFDRLPHAPEFRYEDDNDLVRCPNTLRSAVVLILCILLAGALAWSYL